MVPVAMPIPQSGQDAQISTSCSVVALSACRVQSGYGVHWPWLYRPGTLLPGMIGITGKPLSTICAPNLAMKFGSLIPAAPAPWQPQRLR